MVEITLQEQMIVFIRAFGLHKPDETPCGQPITVAEAHTLMELAQAGMLSQHDLVNRLQLAKSSVSRLVSQLEQQGWVERRRCPQDNRVMELYLTESGRTVADTLAEARRTKFARLFEQIPPEKRPFVMESLAILVEALRESSAT